LSITKSVGSTFKSKAFSLANFENSASIFANCFLPSNSEITPLAILPSSISSF
jgi:hypothetical protein